MDAEENRCQLTRVDDVAVHDQAWSTELSSAVCDAERASSTLRRVAGELPSPESEAWKRFASDVAAAALRFDAQLGTAAARLRAEQDHPESDHPEVHGPLDPIASIRNRVSDVIEDLSHLVTHRAGER